MEETREDVLFDLKATDGLDEQRLLAAEVGHDLRLVDLGGGGDRADRGAGVTVAREQSARGLEHVLTTALGIVGARAAAVRRSVGRVHHPGQYKRLIRNCPAAHG